MRNTDERDNMKCRFCSTSCLTIFKIQILIDPNIKTLVSFMISDTLLSENIGILCSLFCSRSYVSIRILFIKHIDQRSGPQAHIE